MKHASASVVLTCALVAGATACGGGTGEIVDASDTVTDARADSSRDAPQDASPATDGDTQSDAAPDALGDATTTDDAGDAASDAGTGDVAMTSTGDTIATLALANVGLGACSTNTAGFQDYSTSCTGNDGSPEYWCADFALWVWTQAGVDTDTLDAAAGSFYIYGENHGTLHDSPSVGDVAVFNYTGDGVAEHVAIVTEVNSDGTIETVSGDWDGHGSTEAAFSSTSLVVHNTPAYPDTVGGVPDVMGMTISGYVSPHAGTGCFSDTRSEEMLDNACVQDSADAWTQCDNGTWTDRYSDPIPCNGVYAL